ncbi:MAG TPA: DUF2917 domain-containing protein [Rubrivivax sp.]
MHPTAATTKPWEWQLPVGRALRLAPAPVPRWLQVGQGLVWLTATSASGDDNPDRWLATGERQWLPAGTDWVVEGRGDARYLLLEAPLAVRPRRVTAAQRAFAGLMSLVQRLSLTRASQVCV